MNFTLKYNYPLNHNYSYYVKCLHRRGSTISSYTVLEIWPPFYQSRLSAPASSKKCPAPGSRPESLYYEILPAPSLKARFRLLFRRFYNFFLCGPSPDPSKKALILAPNSWLWISNPGQVTISYTAFKCYWPKNKKCKYFSSPNGKLYCVSFFQLQNNICEFTTRTWQLKSYFIPIPLIRIEGEKYKNWVFEYKVIDNCASH